MRIPILLAIAALMLLCQASAPCQNFHSDPNAILVERDGKPRSSAGACRRKPDRDVARPYARWQKPCGTEDMHAHGRTTRA